MIKVMKEMGHFNNKKISFMFFDGWFDSKSSDDAGEGLGADFFGFVKTGKKGFFKSMIEMLMRACTLFSRSR